MRQTQNHDRDFYKCLTSFSSTKIATYNTKRKGGIHIAYFFGKRAKHKSFKKTVGLLQNNVQCVPRREHAIQTESGFWKQPVWGRVQIQQDMQALSCLSSWLSFPSVRNCSLTFIGLKKICGLPQLFVYFYQRLLQMALLQDVWPREVLLLLCYRDNSQRALHIGSAWRHQARRTSTISLIPYNAPIPYFTCLQANNKGLIGVKRCFCSYGHNHG